MDTFSDYSCDLTSVKSKLEETGVAVVPGILSAERCAELRAQAWSELKRLAGLSHDGP